MDNFPIYMTLDAAAKHRELVDGLRDMVRAGRLTEADCPDDFAWLTEKLESAFSADKRTLDDEDESWIAAARDRHHDEGEVEVDDQPIVSPSDTGAYVMAWVWVDRADTDLDGDEGPCAECGGAGDLGDHVPHCSEFSGE